MTQQNHIPRVRLKYTGKSAVASLANGRRFAPKMTPKLKRADEKASRKTPIRAGAVHERSRIASYTSHWFHRVIPHAFCKHEVPNMPNIPPYDTRSAEAHGDQSELTIAAGNGTKTMCAHIVADGLVA